MSDFSNSSNLSDELQSGRTRELLMLLQDKPVPEVQDPMNIQSGLSSDYTQVNSDYEIGLETLSTADRPDDDLSETPSYSANSGNVEVGIVFEPQTDLDGVKLTISSQSSGFTEAHIHDSAGTITDTKDISNLSAGDSVEFIRSFNSSTTYWATIDHNDDYTYGYYGSSSFPYTSSSVNITDGVQFGDPNADSAGYVSISGLSNATTAEVTDQFAAPTTEPADFKAWNAIQARDVTTGGSTSADPVEFEILDSTDTALNSSRIPKARIADEPFTMRNRVYSESAGSDGQNDYQIATTGDGGHFGIPILTVVSVKKNGSVLDSVNWSFDGDTTVTIDTSAVTIESGDTIDIKYDFDVFDSTLQPRAYLNRESTSETSPSISHFEYEYII